MAAQNVCSYNKLCYCKFCKAVQNSILMNGVVTLLVILQIATKDIKKNASTGKITKDTSSIHLNFYIH